MRVSSEQFHTQGFGSISKHQKDILDLQEKMSTGKRINGPGDDPVGYAQVNSINKTLNKIDQFEKNGEYAKASLVEEETAIEDTINNLQRARELTIQMMSSSYNDSNRKATAQEIGQIIEQMSNMMNYTNSQGEKIFAGSTVKADAAFVSDNVNLNNAQGNALEPSSRYYAYIGSQNSGADFDPEANFGSRFVQIGFDNDNRLDPDDLGDPSRVRVTDNGSRVFNIPDGATSLPAGVDPSVINVLVELKDNLEKGLVPPAEISDDLQSGIEQLSLVRAEIGARQNRIESQYDAGQSFTVALEERRMSIEEQDVVEGIAEFTLKSNALQMAQQIFSKVQNMSLFNYIR